MTKRQIEVFMQDFAFFMFGPGQGASSNQKQPTLLSFRFQKQTSST